MNKIAEPLRALAVPIGSVQVHPRNPRQGDIGAIAESIDRWGQLKPIVVQRSTGYIVAGNHLYQAAVQLGWTEVAATVQDLDDREATGFMLADNRTSDLGSYDQDVLKAILVEEARAGNLAATGYDAEDVDAMLLDILHPEKQLQGEAGEAPTLKFMTFGDHKVLVSTEEMEKLVGSWTSYLDDNGTDIGFVHHLLDEAAGFDDPSEYDE